MNGPPDPSRPPGATFDPLPAEALRPRCAPLSFPFETTAAAGDLKDILGQERAREAIRFGLGMRRPGYNLFALGPPGLGKRTMVRQALEARAAGEPVPPDWCYVNDFQNPRAPRALPLPAGRARPFAVAVSRAVDELRAAIPAAFDTPLFHTRKDAIEKDALHKKEAAIEALRQRAEPRGVALLRTPTGLALAPLMEGNVIDAEAFGRLPEDAQQRAAAAMEEVSAELKDIIVSFHAIYRAQRDAARRLGREVTETAVRGSLEDVRAAHSDLPDALAYLDAVEHDVVNNTDAFVPTVHDAGDVAQLLGHVLREAPVVRRYAVNVLVSRDPRAGGPVVVDDHPTLAGLVGRIEQRFELGAMVTDVTLIRPGALHRANGGYLVLDAHKLLAQPFAWDALKRALRSGKLAVQSAAELAGIPGGVTLDAAPIPLDVKVVLVGERELYYALSEADPDFPELFKVAVDFEDTVVRDGDGELGFVRLLGTLARGQGLHPLDRGGMALAVEQASRLAGDATKLSIHGRSLLDLLCEADQLAGASGRATIGADEVRRAVDAQIRRADRVRERLQEEVVRGTILVDTAGAKAGQVNGLSLLRVGELTFGRPNRITARVRVGKGDVIDIEREVDLGGPIHAKGVLILAGFLAGRYAADRALSLTASLVFEQSYAHVEGDSASSAELAALLSAIADIPLRQEVAVTGSVNQHGEMQAVGGINEKIEGFFEVCRARGLTGTQGVIVPAANLTHLVVRPEVVDAAREDRFHVWAVHDIDEVMAILTGLPAAEVHRRVEARLVAFADVARRDLG